MAFLVMTAEDETVEGKMRARENVVHEVGLFQGRLGFAKAIVLLEDGCEEFSNLSGIGQMRFPEGDISPSFGEIRRVLDRESVLPDRVEGARRSGDTKAMSGIHATATIGYNGPRGEVKVMRSAALPTHAKARLDINENDGKAEVYTDNLRADRGAFE